MTNGKNFVINYILIAIIIAPNSILAVVALVINIFWPCTKDKQPVIKSPTDRSSKKPQQLLTETKRLRSPQNSPTKTSRKVGLLT